MTAFFSVADVEGVHDVMAKGTPAEGKVWPSMEVPTSGLTLSEGDAL